MGWEWDDRLIAELIYTREIRYFQPPVPAMFDLVDQERKRDAVLRLIIEQLEGTQRSLRRSHMRPPLLVHEDGTRDTTMSDEIAKIWYVVDTMTLLLCIMLYSNGFSLVITCSVTHP